MSYYKYVKRDEKSRVDWGAITSNLVDTLKEQEADREKQREAITPRLGLQEMSCPMLRKGPIKAQENGF